MASLNNFRLVVFRAVAERLSFRKAADELYLKQPAVSLPVKALEEDLGVQLFDRSGAHIAITPAGRLLLEYAAQAMRSSPIPLLMRERGSGTRHVIELELKRHGIKRS